jgi:hypothetical protein
MDKVIELNMLRENPPLRSGDRRHSTLIILSADFIHDSNQSKRDI